MATDGPIVRGVMYRRSNPSIPVQYVVLGFQSSFLLSSLTGVPNNKLEDGGHAYCSLYLSYSNLNVNLFIGFALQIGIGERKSAKSEL